MLVGVALLVPPEVPAQIPSEGRGAAELIITGGVLLIIVALGDIGPALAMMSARLGPNPPHAVQPPGGHHAFLDNARHSR